MLLQIDDLGDAAPTVARRVVDEHLDALGRGAYAAIARSLSVPREDVVAARDFIRSTLRPSGAPESPAPILPLRPDVVVRAGADGALAVDLPEARHVQIRVSTTWKQLATNPTRPNAERVLARELIAQAQAFMARLRDRREALRTFAEATAMRQERYARGEGPPGALTRAAIARAVGVHESTASRAVADKVVQLATGRLVPFASFFHGATAAEEALARVVAAEQRPLSDPELTEKLAQLGFPLARRTVTKYRERVGIVAHTVR